mmetsp:Transcript_29079/g.43850  ORF Transcript_29079/g.43850 Transcript_29079/m.43850 type:complete len:88 (+) Transcript_29079:465-728(+)
MYETLNIPNEVDHNIPDDETAKQNNRERLLGPWLVKKFAKIQADTSKNIEEIEDLTHTLQRVDFNSRDKATEQEGVMKRLGKSIEVI